MKRKLCTIACTAAMCSVPAVGLARPVGGEFTYKGQLKLRGVPVTDTCDFLFTLWNDETGTLGGDQIGAPMIFDGFQGNPPIDVENGLFTALLDFGATAFTDDPRWLEIAVTCPTGVGTLVTLSPRERVTPVPFAIHTRGITVNETGTVGIGSATDDNALDAAGHINVGADGFDAHIELRSDGLLSSTTMRLKMLDGVGLTITDDQDKSKMTVTAGGRVGIGTTRPATKLHVVGSGSFLGSHIAYFDSVSGTSSDGIAIRLANTHTNKDNNYLTFLNGVLEVTGRVEGFDTENGDWIAPPPLPIVSLTVDPGVRLNTNWFDPGSLPTVTHDAGTLPSIRFQWDLPSASLEGGTPPSMTGGSFPALSFNSGSLPGLNRGSFPTLSFNDGTLPDFTGSNCFIGTVQVLCGFEWDAGATPTADLIGGSLPSLIPGTLPTASLTGGSFPTLLIGRFPTLNFDPGSIPNVDFSRGTLPSLTFDGGTLPALVGAPVSFVEPSFGFDLPTQQELSDLFCWSFENGVSDFLTLDPVSIAAAQIKAQAACACKDEGVTYGSKGADYAKWLPKLNPDDRFQFAQIVGIHGGKVSLKTEGAEQIMAISRAPVVVGNVPPEGEKDSYITVGFMGQLPVGVHGKVKAGDYILPSGREDGTTIAIAPEDLKLEHLGRTLGRAWSDSENEVYNLINVVIGINGNEAAIILAKQRKRMDVQTREQLALATENNRLKAQLNDMNGKLAAVMAAVQELQDSTGGKAACHMPLASVGANR